MAGRAARWLRLLVFLLAAACAALPDVSPFAIASRQLAGAVKTGGAAISEGLRTSPDLEAKAQEFDRAWTARNEAMRAVVGYSDGLVAIVKATADSRESARGLADKLGALAQGAGAVQPGAGPAIKVGADSAAFIWAQIALARGASSLRDALSHAQPAIDRLAEIIGSDTRDLVNVVRGAAEAERTTLNAAFNETRGFELSLSRRRGELRRQGFGQLDREELAELRRIDELMAPVNAQVQTYEEHRAKIDRREKASLQLIAATRDAMERWAVAHADVTVSLQNRRPVSVEALTEGAIELRRLITRMQEL